MEIDNSEPREFMCAICGGMKLDFTDDRESSICHDCKDSFEKSMPDWNK